uniref:BTB domain-containing protein n=1 Tax=Globodera rostochiensis TaxID=31243 RepID=A0A914IDQ1_GLORO
MGASRSRKTSVVPSPLHYHPALSSQLSSVPAQEFCSESFVESIHEICAHFSTINLDETDQQIASFSLRFANGSLNGRFYLLMARLIIAIGVLQLGCLVVQEAIELDTLRLIELLTHTKHPALATAGAANDTVLAAENPVDVLMSIVNDVDSPAVMLKLKNLCEYVTLQLVKKFLRAVSQKYRCLDPTKEFLFPKHVSGMYGVTELFALKEGEHSVDSRTAQALLIKFDFSFKHLFEFGEAEQIRRLYLDSQSDIFRFCFESQLTAVHVHRTMESADIQWPPDKDRMEQCDCMGCAGAGSTEHTAVVSGDGATSATTNLVAAGGSTVVVSGGATSTTKRAAAATTAGTSKITSKRAKNTTAAAADFDFALATDSDKFADEEGWTQCILLDEMREKLQFVKTGSLKQGVVYAIQDKRILELYRKHRFYLVMLCSRKNCGQAECTKCPTTKHPFLLVDNKTFDPSDDHWFVHKNDLRGLLRAAEPKE